MGIPIPTLSAEQQAWVAARSQYLQQQALAIMTQVATLKVSLLCADQRGELAPELKTWLRAEFSSLYALMVEVEVKK